MEMLLSEIARSMPGKLNSVVKAVMNQLGIADPNEAIWHEKKKGIIRFTLPPTSGITGPQWVMRCEKSGIVINWRVKEKLLSGDQFMPTKGVINDVVVLRGSLFPAGKPSTQDIFASAHTGEFTKGEKLYDPNVEVAFLIREMITREEIKKMGLSTIIVMHELFEIVNVVLLSVDGFNVGEEYPHLKLREGNYLRRWDRKCGFAFVANSFPRN